MRRVRVGITGFFLLGPTLLGTGCGPESEPAPPPSWEQAAKDALAALVLQEDWAGDWYLHPWLVGWSPTGKPLLGDDPDQFVTREPVLVGRIVEELGQFAVCDPTPDVRCLPSPGDDVTDRSVFKLTELVAGSDGVFEIGVRVFEISSRDFRDTAFRVQLERVGERWKVAEIVPVEYAFGRFRP